ncbi:putative transcriptional regulator [Vibrio nigripulchritudo ATCC 27043]|uniref:winged helix-turn-helix transcriptional regulator n=1 Tax=Vibrio TaxID=662 RepID=UPI00021C0E00|nr:MULTISPECIES: helix-turn-helix domain-containing protein [Vibrio]EGU57768.1 putative transcriptional regulator [Vibrio nigripulchritudo ATCC 27043]UAB73461.1 helix-turn-helix transcriptional regulator [Vibrio sp. SCSIO 43132]
MSNTSSSSEPAFLRSGCPIVNGLDIFGDKWTLVVLRDLHCGKKTYGELADSPEHIPTNRLAERLKKLESEGLITKELYQERPKRYQYLLTDKGMEILPILQAISRWSNKHIDGTWIPPQWFMDKEIPPK